MYSPSEITSLLAWFDEHLNELPKEIEFLSGAKTSDFPTTYKSYKELILNTLESPTYNIYVHHLMQIKETYQKRP